ncbi:MAG: LysE family transporter, partial [Lachnospiraceae bacterium]|nr:LysE family transporter [Lachnospiraceae bacterium]
KGQEAVTGNSSKGNIIFYFLSSFFAAIMNPASVLSFIAAFTLLGINGSLSFAEGAGLLSGILSGTLCWWAALAGIISMLRDRVTCKIYKVLNIILGSLMLVFGAAMIIKGVAIVPVKALR